MKCIEKSYVNDYLDRSRAMSPLTTLREMTDVESAALGAIENQRKELNKLLMEIITISSLIKRFTIQVVGTNYLVCNMVNMGRSVKKQRDKLSLIRTFFLHVQPTANELMAIRVMIEETKKRIIHIRTHVIPGNLELTPVKEYMEIKGIDSFTDDMYAFFGNSKAIYEASQNGEEDKYADMIYQTVAKAGKLGGAAERLEGFVDSEKARVYKQRLENSRFKIRQKHDAATNGMTIFTRNLYRCVRTLEASKPFGISGKAVIEKFAQERVNQCIILCCYELHDGHFVYRYINQEGGQEIFLKDAYIFSSDEAKEMAGQLGVKFPFKAYYICDLVRD